MKVVINKCFGGFGLSLRGTKRLLELKGEPCYFYKQTKYSFRNESDEFTLINNLDDDSMFVFTLTKFLGATTNELPNDSFFSNYGINRDDPLLVQVVEDLGEKANGPCSRLVIVEIPDGVEWEIDEYDGLEHIAEKHRIWG